MLWAHLMAAQRELFADHVAMWGEDLWVPGRCEQSGSQSVFEHTFFFEHCYFRDSMVPTYENCQPIVLCIVVAWS
jgi:hypothetical protein